MITAVKKVILRRLVNANIWGGKHTPQAFVIKGVPQRIRHTVHGRRVIKKAFKELLGDEWIRLAPKRTGRETEDHVSLNPRKVREIREFLNS